MSGAGQGPLELGQAVGPADLLVIALLFGGDSAVGQHDCRSAISLGELEFDELLLLRPIVESPSHRKSAWAVDDRILAPHRVLGSIRLAHGDTHLPADPKV